jgi:threonine dehydrogenase-like Zn-dependent dehydrogenase
MRVSFDTVEYTASGALEAVQLGYDGDENRGWTITRNGSGWLELGAGYRLMQSVACGVCSTDLARRFLPFPLPQVTGHEVIALDDNAERFAVGINASHRARQIEADCPFCRSGLANHCPDRLVLGIHDLPGGFAPWFLAPVGALRRIPSSVSTENAVLIEPLAAALNAVQSIEIRQGDRVAVLGPRKLGMLVVDELALEMFSVSAVERLRPAAGRVAAVVAWTARSEPPSWLSESAAVIRTRSVAELAESLRNQPPNGLPKADAVVVDSLEELVQAIRPSGFGEYSPVRSTGIIFYAGQAPEGVSLLQRLQQKKLRLSSSRCGDFDAAIELLTSDEALHDLGAQMITHRFPAARLADAFEAAAAKECVKAVVTHQTP